MLSLAAHVRIDVHLPPTDLRKSFDGLTGLVRSAFQADPRDGSWFLFFNHRRDRVKILAWEPDWYSIWDKRLESATFESLRAVADGQSRELDSTGLTLLLSGVSIQTAQRRRRFFLSDCVVRLCFVSAGTQNLPVIGVPTSTGLYGG